MFGAIGNIGIDSPSTESAEEGLEMVGGFATRFGSRYHLANGPSISGSVGDCQHAVKAVAVLVVIALKRLLIDHNS